MFGPEDVEITLEATDGSTALVRVSTPVGPIHLIGEVFFDGDTMRIDRAHIDGPGAGRIGRGGLNAICAKLMVVADVGHIIIQDGTRTPAETPAGRPAPSGSRVRLLLKASGGLSHPVAVARTLADLGMSLRAAHAAVDRLAEGGSHGVEIVTEDSGKAIDLLGERGVQAAAIRRPIMVAKVVREGFGLSQRDFAIRFGLELRTVQNWEQERHGLDAATTILLALIARSPESVERVLTSSP